MGFLCWLWVEGDLRLGMFLVAFASAGIIGGLGFGVLSFNRTKLVSDELAGSAAIHECSLVALCVWY